MRISVKTAEWLMHGIELVLDQQDEYGIRGYDVLELEEIYRRLKNETEVLLELKDE